MYLQWTGPEQTARIPTASQVSATLPSTSLHTAQIGCRVVGCGWNHIMFTYLMF